MLEVTTAPVTAETVVETPAVPEATKNPAADAKVTATKKVTVKKVPAKRALSDAKGTDKGETILPKGERRKPAAAPKKTVTKKAVKKAEAPTPKSKPRSDGLRKPQVRILKMLAKMKGPCDRTKIAQGAPVDVSMCTEYIGSSNKDVRLANDVKHFPSLLTLKLISEDTHDVNGKDVTAYTITDKGRAELAKLG